MAMNKFTLEQRYQIIQTYFENQSSIRRTYRQLAAFYNEHERPSEQAIRRTVDRFRNTHSLHDAIKSTRRRNVRTEETIAAVIRSVADDPGMSLRRRSQQLGLCMSTTWKIMRKDLGVQPYKIQLVQELKPQDHQLRRTFADWALGQLDTDPLFYRRVLFTDEAHFWLHDYVDKENCRIWGEGRPAAGRDTGQDADPLGPDRCTVWCGLHAGGIVGPYFFKDEAGECAEVTPERYRAMLTDFAFQNLGQLDPDEVWFQQDGASGHTAPATIDLLRSKFGERVISKNAPVNWPPRSCDMTPLDYFLWGYVKQQAYTNKPASIDALEENITRVIREIRPVVLEKVTQDWTARMRYVKSSRGGHLSEIIFSE